jgi:hypothetical protein
MGIVPGAWARELIAQGQEEQGAPGRVRSAAHDSAAGDSAKSLKELKTWVRRLYTAPGTGDPVAMDSRRRLFPAPLRRFIQFRGRHLPDALQ